MTVEARRTRNRHPEQRAAIRAAMAPYALIDGPHLMMCRPGPIELAFFSFTGDPRWSGNNGKICFGDEAGAQAAADEISALDGVDAVTVYRCPRGDHYHHVSVKRRLATTEAAVTRVAVAARRARERAA